jgi:hypothetical protein
MLKVEFNLIKVKLRGYYALHFYVFEDTFQVNINQN